MASDHVTGNIINSKSKLIQMYFEMQLSADTADYIL